MRRPYPPHEGVVTRDSIVLHTAELSNGCAQ